MGFLKTLKRHAPTVHEAIRIIKNRRFEIWPPRITYAYGDLHARLTEHFDFRNGVYFEVGANDGLDGSNTAYLERYLGWRGILVEAVPSLFLKCLENRPNAKSYHAALVPDDFESDHIEIIYANQMSLTRLSHCDIDEHVERQRPWSRYDEPASIGQAFLAPTRTAQQLMDAAGLGEIDLFSLDVEGAELSVLKGIDFTRSRPRHFLIEAWEIENIEAFLVSKGYRLVKKLAHADYLFARD